MLKICFLLLFVASYRAFSPYPYHPSVNSLLPRSIRNQGTSSSTRKNPFVLAASKESSDLSETERKELWKSISALEKQAVDLLCKGEENDIEHAYKLFAQSVTLKKTDPFLQLADQYSHAEAEDNTEKCQTIMTEMKTVSVPPHLSSLAELKKKSLKADSLDEEDDSNDDSMDEEDVDPGSTFSDTVTGKEATIRLIPSHS